MSTSVPMPVRVKPPPAELDLPALRRERRGLRLHLSARLLHGLLGDQLATDQVLVALDVAPALRELREVLIEHRLRGVQLRLGLRERRPLGGVVQPSEHLALLHVIALLDQHRGQRAGDLRRHGGFAARGHVAGRIENRGTRGAGRQRLRERGMHSGGRRTRQAQPDAAGEHHGEHADGSNEPAGTAGTHGWRGLAAIDAQLS
jgi:hypothetical protein